ncbi:hypothetical protein PR048_025210 [Dryococelus australis]|uniref:Uncharacterized protein n=1 Tax=Dryococelus australis TaxID=614101 RepID=A0ABQ9GQQ8_9NEOP|nr:hypothetical protein PR048_025210 [Dryococelus australis]
MQDDTLKNRIDIFKDSSFESQQVMPPIHPAPSVDAWSRQAIMTMQAGETGDPRENPPNNGTSGTISTCGTSVTRPGIEPDSPLWEASVLVAQPPWTLETVAIALRSRLLPPDGVVGRRIAEGCDPGASPRKTSRLPPYRLGLEELCSFALFKQCQTMEYYITDVVQALGPSCQECTVGSWTIVSRVYCGFMDHHVKSVLWVHGPSCQECTVGSWTIMSRVYSRCVIAGPSSCEKTCVLLSLLEEENGLRFENVYLYLKSPQQSKYRRSSGWPTLFSM